MRPHDGPAPHYSNSREELRRCLPTKRQFLTSLSLGLRLGLRGGSLNFTTAQHQLGLHIPSLPRDSRGAHCCSVGEGEGAGGVMGCFFS